MSKSASRLKIIQTVYTSFMLAVAVFIGVAIYTSQPMELKIDYEDSLTFIVPVLTVVGIFGGSFIYKSSLKSILSSDSLDQKLAKFSAANIVRGALLEGPALLATVGAMNGKNYYFLIFSGILLLMMYFFFPTKNHFVEQARLTFEEKSEINTL